MSLSKKEKEEIEEAFGIKLDDRPLSDAEKEEKKKRIEVMFENLGNNEEYQKKSDKLEKLKEQYEEKFGEKIEYYPIDLEEYNIDNEIKLVEKALEDNKPFISEDSTIDGITVLGKKLKWWF